MHCRGSLSCLPLPNMKNSNGLQTHTTFGIAAVIAAGVTALAPQAAAQELAPGLNCGSDYICHNDTDDIYRVSWRVSCTTGPGERSVTWVGTHRAATLRPACPFDYRPGFTPDFSDWVPGTPLSVEYLGAEVDNDPAAHGGASAGSAGVP